MGCYSFANHVLAAPPRGADSGSRSRRCSRRCAAEFPERRRCCIAPGCAVEGDDRSGFAEAVSGRRGADVAVVVVGDRAGLFGRGTVGEGNDVETSSCPGVQRRAGRGGRGHRHPRRPRAADRAAVRGRLGAGRGSQRPPRWSRRSSPARRARPRSPRSSRAPSNPSGRLPVSLPRSAGAQPYSYLHPILGGPTEITSAEQRPDAAVRLRPHRTPTFTHDRAARRRRRRQPAAAFRASVRVRNTGSRTGTDVVQLYGRDVFASVTRPVAQLLGYTRVTLEAGAGDDCRVRRADHAARLHRTRRPAHRRTRRGRAVGRRRRAPTRR